MTWAGEGSGPLRNGRVQKNRTLEKKLLEASEVSAITEEEMVLLERWA